MAQTHVYSRPQLSSSGTSWELPQQDPEPRPLSPASLGFLSCYLTARPELQMTLFPKFHSKKHHLHP